MVLFLRYSHIYMTSFLLLCQTFSRGLQLFTINSQCWIKLCHVKVILLLSMSLEYLSLFPKIFFISIKSFFPPTVACDPTKHLRWFALKPLSTQILFCYTSFFLQVNFFLSFSLARTYIIYDVHILFFLCVLEKIYL